MKEYNGHSRKFYVHVEKGDFVGSMKNPPDQDIILEILKDMEGMLSPAACFNIAKWCLQQIKEQQENNPANVNWYEDALKEIQNLK